MGKGQMGYRKGDEHAGGGGSLGGSGKRGEPIQGWEKGDIVRDVASVRDPHEMPRKPGRRIEGYPFAEKHKNSVYDALRSKNAKVMASLEELAHTSVSAPEKLRSKLEMLVERAAHQRHFEELIVLRTLADAGVESRLVDKARTRADDIEGRLQALKELPVQSTAFQVHFKKLHDLFAQHIHHQEHRLLPILERMIPPSEAEQLAVPPGR